jgi:hypothetical protein
MSRDYADTREEMPTTYDLWKKAQEKTYLGSWPTAAQLAFFGYLAANKEQAGQVLGFTSTAVFIALVLLMGLAAAIGVSVSSAVCYAYTGIVYGKDREAFALAGGFDVGRVPILVAQAGMYGLYWWTSQMTPDPITFLRGPWLFLAVTTVVGLVLTAVVSCVVFKGYQDSTLEE